ncbi:hypothetical protein LY76DRAFT_516866, partial [Colletotrichum caudatum]
NYEGRVKKGGCLRAPMPLNNTQATEANGAAIVSSFQDPNNAARWGWSLGTEKYPFERAKQSFEYRGEELENPAFQINIKQSGLYFYYHNEAFTEPARAANNNFVNPNAGATIFHTNISPKYMVEEYRFGIGTVPSLKRLSDYAFFQRLKGYQCRRINPKYLRFAFRMNIRNEATVQVIIDAIKEAGFERVPVWKYHANIKTGTRQGDAILGTTHGAGVAWMLIQHKDVLGVKEIDEVGV